MIIYAFCLVLGLMFTVVSAFLGHLFGGHDAIGTGGQADAGMNSDGMPGASFLSPTVLACFITAFGAFGLVFTEIPATQSVWLHAPLAFISGLLIAVLVWWGLNKVFRGANSSSEGRVASLVGQTAAIISPIPMSGVGEISYVQSGSRYTAPARDEKGGMIATGQTVKITRIVGTQFYVEATN